MKLKNILPILLFFASFTFYGQNEMAKVKKEQIKTLKVAFITNELSLTSDEAEKFWPVYNTFDDKQFELRHQKKNVFMKKMDDSSLDSMSEKEASALLTQMENTDEELFILKKKLVSNLKNIISPLKILKLKKAEEDFNRKLLKQYRDKKSKK